MNFNERIDVEYRMRLNKALDLKSLIRYDAVLAFRLSLDASFSEYALFSLMNYVLSRYFKYATEALPTLYDELQKILSHNFH